MNEANNLLQKEFGLKAFRSHQEGVIKRLLVDNKSALAIMPTGSGKSLCYQIPALCLSGLTLVVSPLKALMKDQVDALSRKGISAGRLDSSQTKEEYLDTMAKIRSGKIKLLYVAPERLNMEGFMEMIRNFPISLLAVDESHCVAEWGSSFRPDYLKIARFAVEYKAERILCLTATATRAVAFDICQSFGIDKEEAIFKAATYRSNLELDIIGISSDPFGEKRTQRLVENLRANPGSSIVYVATKKHTLVVAQALSAMDIPTRPYHGGMGSEARKEAQDWFMREQNAVICATIAFGMGIDKPNIRNIIHFNMPKTLESYSQEIGRAGRDGALAKCTFYFCPDDRQIIRSFTRGDTPSRKSVRDWFRRVCHESQGLAVGDVLVVDQCEQKQLFDIRDVTLGLLFAQLELNFHFLRATTPINEKYEFKTTTLYHSASSDDSHAASAIREHSHLKRKWHAVDIVAAARSIGANRGVIVAKLQEWDGSGWIELKARLRRGCYFITNAFPTDPSEIDDVAEKIYLQLERRENRDVARVDRLVTWAKASECLARGLAEYFGDNLRARCGQCTVCKSGRPVKLHDPAPLPFDQAAFDRVLGCTSIRDDARFLARIAFGIKSPRLTREKVTRKNPAFGSLVRHDFVDLLARFQAVVDRAQSEGQASTSQANITNPRTPTPTPPSPTLPTPTLKRKAPSESAEAPPSSQKPRRA